MHRLLPIPVVLAAVLGCQAPPPPPAPCECPPAPVPAPAADCAPLEEKLEACRERLRACEQDPFKGGKYFTGDAGSDKAH